VTNSFARVTSPSSRMTNGSSRAPKASARSKNRTHPKHLRPSPAAARRSLASETERARTRLSRKNRSQTSLFSCTLPSQARPQHGAAAAASVWELSANRGGRAAEHGSRQRVDQTPKQKRTAPSPPCMTHPHG
jgi:hypothetical protein